MSRKGTAKHAKRILSISYDEALLHTREALLLKFGYRVESAYGFAEALSRLKKRPLPFDLIMLGHTLPINDKHALIAAMPKSSKAAVLSIRRHGYDPIPEASYSVDEADGIEALLKAIKAALRK